MSTWHGVGRGYVRDGVSARTLRELASDRVVLDRNGVLAAWGEREDFDSTVIVGVRRQPSRDVPRVELASRTWIDVFQREVLRIAQTNPGTVVALGGGCDAAAILVAWLANGLPKPRVCTVAAGLAEYDETETALAIARQLDLTCEVIDIVPARLVELAPVATAIAETALYNLHPVHRLALARELRRRGATTLVTGDGADAVFAGVPDHDYVPIVVALTASALGHSSPFFADAIVAGTPCDPTKQLLRDYLRANKFDWLADRPKRSRLAPALDLDPILDRDRIATLARSIDLPPALDTDRERVGWATLDHLVRALEAPGGEQRDRESEINARRREPSEPDGCELGDINAPPSEQNEREVR